MKSLLLANFSSSPMLSWWPIPTTNFCISPWEYCWINYNTFSAVHIFLSFLETFIDKTFSLSVGSADFLCFHYFSGRDWFAASSHEFDENKQLDHEHKINFLLFDIFHSYFIKATDIFFLGVYWRNKPISAGYWKACTSLGLTFPDLQAFLLFSKHPGWFILPVNRQNG